MHMRRRCADFRRRDSEANALFLRFALLASSAPHRLMLNLFHLAEYDIIYIASQEAMLAECRAAARRAI